MSRSATGALYGQTDPWCHNLVYQPPRPQSNLLSKTLDQLFTAWIKWI